jgi:hypothetical protein
VLPDADVVGTKLLSDDRTLQTNFTQAFPTIMNQFLGSNALRKVFPIVGLWGMSPLLGEGNAPVEVDAISGASFY